MVTSGAGSMGILHVQVEERREEKKDKMTVEFQQGVW